LVRCGKMTDSVIGWIRIAWAFGAMSSQCSSMKREWWALSTYISCVVYLLCHFIDINIRECLEWALNGRLLYFSCFSHEIVILHSTGVHLCSTCRTSALITTHTEKDWHVAGIALRSSFIRTAVMEACEKAGCCFFLCEQLTHHPVKWKVKLILCKERSSAEMLD